MITDAGDIPVADGRRIRAGAVFRISGGLIDPDDLGALEAAALRRVVDLRGEDENRSVVQNWARDTGVEYIAQPIPAANKDDFDKIALDDAGEDEAAEFMTALYLRIVDDFGDQLAGTIAALADETPAGFGCAAGKDRTGIVNALLHVLLGVPEEEAARRYVNGAPAMERLSDLARDYLELEDGDPLPTGITVFLKPAPDTLLTTLDRVKSTHGGVREYLEDHGLEPEAAQGLRERLLVPPA